MIKAFQMFMLFADEPRTCPGMSPLPDLVCRWGLSITLCFLFVLGSAGDSS